MTDPLSLLGLIPLCGCFYAGMHWLDREIESAFRHYDGDIASCPICSANKSLPAPHDAPTVVASGLRKKAAA